MFSMLYISGTRFMMFIRPFLLTSLVAVLFADSTTQSLPFSQNWTSSSLITANDSWSGVPGIIGYRGDDLTTATGADPQTLLADGAATPVNVIANQSAPNSLATGGVAEFDGIADPTIALNGSGTADAPHIVIKVATTGRTSINVKYNVRDLDGSADNAIQRVALHYRVGDTGSYTNVPAAYVADATEASLATKVTAVDVILPTAAENQAVVYLRIMTTNAVGNDEWVGIDDISVTGTATGPTNPTISGTAAPSSVAQGQNFNLAASVAPGANPTSASYTVIADLTSIGGSASTSVPFVSGVNFALNNVTVAIGTSIGGKTIPLSVTDDQARSGTFNLVLTVTSANPTCTPTTTISTIQGIGNQSTFLTQNHTVQGIVTAIKSNGFFLQGASDSNPSTSDAMFVFTSSTPATSPGDSLCVSGTVSEFPSASSAVPTDFGLTQLSSSPTYFKLGTAALPAPVILSSSDVTPGGGLYQLERFEAMRVQFSSLVSVSPTEALGIFYAVPQGTNRPFREPGIDVTVNRPAATPAGTPAFDHNPEMIRVDSDGQVGAPVLTVTSNVLINNITGVLDFATSFYTFLPDASPAPSLGPLSSLVAVPVPTPVEFTIGTINLERFYDNVSNTSGADNDGNFINRRAKAARVIRDVMRLPDIVGVVEVENLNALQSLATELNAGYSSYLFEGNDPSKINVGFLVKSRITVNSVVQEGKSTQYTPPIGSAQILNDRPPLVLSASFNGFSFTVIANHLRSLINVSHPGSAGENPRAKRRAQAEFLAGLVQSLQAAKPNEAIALIGDFNAFQFSDGYVDSIGTIRGVPTPASMVTLSSADLVNPDFTALVETLPATQRYSYSFEGNAQTLDHILINPAFQRNFRRFAVGRVNADFPVSWLTDFTRTERASDHDPAVAYFSLFPVINGRK